MNLFKKNSELHPENSNELLSWSKKWNISLNELGRAIVDTGTTNIRELRRHIRKSKSDRHTGTNYPGISDLALSK